MPKLTKRTIDATDAQPTKFFLWDEGIPGFGLRVMPSGRKSFVVQFRVGRRARRMSLGPSTVLTCDQARTRAITIIAAVKNGEDPAADRAAKRNAATVSDLAERFDIHVRGRIVSPWQPSMARSPALRSMNRVVVAFSDHSRLVLPMPDLPKMQPLIPRGSASR